MSLKPIRIRILLITCLAVLPDQIAQAQAVFSMNQLAPLLVFANQQVEEKK